MEHMDAAVERTDTLNTAVIDAACDFLKDKDYAAVQRIVAGTLPRLAADAYAERIRLYILLLALPGHPINRTLQEDSLRVTRHILTHREQFSQQYRLFAHLVFDAWKGEATLDTERHEFFALQDAQDVLMKSDSSREERDCALTVIVSQSPDHEQVRCCLEELFNGANTFAITHACTLAPVAFHRETNMQYLEQALDQIQGPPGFIADILKKKMAVLLRILEEDTEVGTLDRKAFHVQMTMCHANLHMIPQAVRHHAYSEYYLGYAAVYLNETELGLIHTYTAIAMARQLGLTHLEQLALALRDHLQSRAPYDGEE